MRLFFNLLHKIDQFIWFVQLKLISLHPEIIPQCVRPDGLSDLTVFFPRRQGF